MNNELQQIIDTLRQLSSNIERKDWFTNNRVEIIKLLADLFETNRDHCAVVIEDIIDLISNRDKGKLRQEIKFHVDTTIKQKVNERQKDHFNEEIKLERDAKGNVRATIENIVIVLLASKHLLLRNDDFTGMIFYEVYGEHKLPWETFSNAIEVKYPVEHSEKKVMSVKYYSAMGQYELAALMRYLQTFFKDEMNWRMLKQAIILAAGENHINIHQEYIRCGLPENDGIDRMDFLCRHAGVKNRQWAIIVGRLILVAIMARCFEPGYDYRPFVIFEGNQDIGKSRLCRLFSFHDDFFVQFTFDKYSNNNETTRRIAGNAIVEFPDMGGINSKDSNYIKAFMTSTQDTNRRMHQDLVEHIKRCGVFMITTNYSEPYFSDQTGNSRYAVCPCEIDRIDIDAIRSELPMLLAQAYAMWKAGATPRLTDEEKIIQQSYLTERETKPDYYHLVLQQLRIHKDQMVHEWDDGFKLDEMVNWITSFETWNGHLITHKERSEIVYVIKHYFHFANVNRKVPVLSRSGGIEQIKKWRYVGEINWFDFIKEFED